MGEARKLVSPARVFARPTADNIWLGPTQQAALSQLSRPAQVRLVLGPSSSGKSTLLTHLTHRLDPNGVVLQCRGPKHDAMGVLASLLVSAELTAWELSEIEQRNLLTVFVQQRRSQGRRVFLVLDDVHGIKPAAWEEIERLLVLKFEKRPALELLVAGPTSTAQHFQTGEDGPREGGLLVCNLSHASSEDVIGYLDWRLSRFEMRDALTPVAAQVMARLCGGRYAAADVLCQMSLLLLRQLSLDRVDARVVRQAVAALAARQGSKLETDAPTEPKDPLDSLPQGHLLITKSGKVVARSALGQRTLLGRSEHNDVCLPSPYMSRHHAVIVGTPEGYYLVDLNSVNGVVLNGQRVERAVLCDQDVLAIGPFRLKVQIPDLVAGESPLPQAESLADTAVMPPQADEATAVWRVK
jgi:energy-coupling factor transporter ATP-binding protein EcfA2